MEDFSGLWFDCESFKTVTSEEQCNCEKECATFLKPFNTATYKLETLEKLKNGELINYDREIRLLRSMHSIYLINGLSNLPAGFVSLDASRPWICYWILHALYLLEKEPKYLHIRIISTLSHMQNKDGGFGGGPMQLSQGAPNYAAVLALCIIGTTESYSIIDRPAMYNYFLRMKHSCGGFTIHRDGEVDSRSTYTVIAIARVLNMLTPELTEGVADYVLQCQTYEGGFGGEPGNEAHGGYNFCALATLLILGQAHRCDMKAQEHWLLNRQVRLEGGFQGRTNKLVDSCYSFWQGAALAMCEIVRRDGSDLFDMEQYLLFHASKSSNNSSNSSDSNCSSGDVAEKSSSAEQGQEEITLIDLPETSRVKHIQDTSGCLSFNQKALQRYVLHCAQNLDGGGMRDKPGKSRDFYHSCYALSGLSIAQSCMVAAPASDLPVSSGDRSSSSGVRMEVDGSDAGSQNKTQDLPSVEYDWSGAQVYGDYDNLLAPTSAVFNIGLLKLKGAIDFFADKESRHQELLELYRLRTT